MLSEEVGYIHFTPYQIVSGAKLVRFIVIETGACAATGRLRSREIGLDGVIDWRAEGDGIDQETIMGFVRQRMERLDRWPTKE